MKRLLKILFGICYAVTVIFVILALNLEEISIIQAVMVLIVLPILIIITPLFE